MGLFLEFARLFINSFLHQTLKQNADYRSRLSRIFAETATVVDTKPFASPLCLNPNFHPGSPLSDQVKIGLEIFNFRVLTLDLMCNVLIFWS